MAIRVEDNQIFLGVRDLLAPSFRQQMVSSFPLPQRGLLGRQAQTKVQRQKNRQYGLFHSEYFIQRTFSYHEYQFTITGRIDGVFRLQQRAEIEEIKSVILTAAEFRRLKIEKYPEFVEQVLFYAYLLQDELEGAEIVPYLILVNLINDAQRKFKVPYHRQATERLLQQRLAQIVANIRRERETIERRRREISVIDFPLPEERPQQQQMMAVVRDCLEEQNHLMVSAPTGTGKTAAALYPAVQFAYPLGKKIFFVTSKNTQQQIVAETLQPLVAQGLKLKVAFLRAREKMCANDVYFCHEAFCPYLKDYQERLQATNLVEELLEQGFITPDAVYDRARSEMLCPFEVSLDAMAHGDVVVGDYNYVFDPAVYLRRLFAKKDHADWILIVDEAHNLYERGMAYLSPALSYEKLRNLISQYESRQEKVYRKLTAALRRLSELFEQLQLEGEVYFSGQRYFQVQLNVQQWMDGLALYEAAFIKYLILKVKKRLLIMDDPLENWYYALRRFVQVARLQDRAFVPYYAAENGGVLQIQCCDPSRYLGERIDAFHSVVAMSATFDPLPFFREVLGFPEYRTRQLQLDSPFPAEHRRVIIVPHISTRYKDRLASYPKIAKVIREVIEIRPGNYLVFFPSFDFIQHVNLFLANLPVEKILQTPGMDEQERDRILERLKNEPEPHLLLAVMGGVFSEGVDYSGSMAIGVMVVGPGLPQISYPRELLRQYYDQQNEMGMAYAYVYPGMNKVIQAVGRLIRSASDRGIVVLIGERFAADEFNAILPEYWFKREGDLVITDHYKQAIREFWQKMEREEEAPAGPDYE